MISSVQTATKDESGTSLSWSLHPVLALSSHGLPCAFDRTATTHSNAGPVKLIADSGPPNAQLGTDLAQAPSLGIQLGRMLNVLASP
jgi:hypothetical protein